ncbi:Porphyromonas gingivalis major fimbrial subunit protein (FimA), partial [Gilliamella apis SCGC AB-598-P17]
IKINSGTNNGTDSDSNNGTDNGTENDANKYEIIVFAYNGSIIADYSYQSYLVTCVTP